MHIRTFLKPLSFIPAIILMYLIFTFSAQNGEMSSSVSYKASRIIVETADRLFDVGLEDWQIDGWAVRINGVTRKLAHMTEYFALAVAVSFPLYVYGLRGIWLMLLAGLICVGYASLDEYHQTFITGRSGQPKDVAIDSIGIFFGILITRIVGWTGRMTIFRPLEDERNRREIRREQKALQKQQTTIRRQQEEFYHQQQMAQDRTPYEELPVRRQRTSCYDSDPMPGGRQPYCPNGPAPDGRQPYYPNGPAPDGRQPFYPNGPAPDGRQPFYPNGSMPDGYQPYYPNGPVPDGRQPYYPNGPVPDGQPFYPEEPEDDSSDDLSDDMPFSRLLGPKRR